MLYVADGRDRAAIDGYFEAVGEEGCALIEMVAWTCGRPTSGRCESTPRR